jgi:hypothetical protein
MTIPENRDPKLPMAQSSATSPASRLDAALAAKPAVQIPADFAAKVAVLALVQPARPRRRVPQMGKSMALVLAPLVAIAMFALAPHSSPNVKSVIFDTEMILIAQLALIGWWVSRATGMQSPRWR